MHSLGERKMDPSTPCSASIECGGRRSTLAESISAGFLRRLRLRSMPPCVASGRTESIIAQVQMFRCSSEPPADAAVKVRNERIKSKRQMRGANNLRLLETAHMIFTKLLTCGIVSTVPYVTEPKETLEPPHVGCYKEDMITERRAACVRG